MHSHYNVDIAHFKKKNIVRYSLMCRLSFTREEIFKYTLLDWENGAQSICEKLALKRSPFSSICTHGKWLHVYITLVKIDHRIISPTNTQSTSKLPHLIMVCSC